MNTQIVSVIRSPQKDFSEITISKDAYDELVRSIEKQKRDFY